MSDGGSTESHESDESPWTRVNVAVFRPDDDRMAAAVELLESLGATPIADPMLAVEPTGAMPESADFVILTSKTGVELVAETGWNPGGSIVCAIGSSTAEALRNAGYAVDVVPDEYSSRGLIEGLADRVAGKTVEVARSDHGSDVLLDGLRDAGADVHETVLYRLVRPEGAGRSTEFAAGGDLEAACFTSSLTVTNFLESAAERAIDDEARAGLGDAVVGAIGEPTAETLREEGIRVDVVPETADFSALATAVVEVAAPSHHE